MFLNIKQFHKTKCIHYYNWSKSVLLGFLLQCLMRKWREWPLHPCLVETYRSWHCMQRCRQTIDFILRWLLADFLSLSVSLHWNAQQTEVYIAMGENDQEIGHRLIACSFCLRSTIPKARDSRSLMSTSLKSQTAPPVLSATHSRSETTPLAWLCAERRTRKSCECCHEGFLQLVLGGKIKSYTVWKD